MSTEAEREAFREKLKSLQFGFRYGKAEFHGPTVRERVEHMHEQAKFTGVIPEKISTRAELI